jgi:hypothetical protein
MLLCFVAKVVANTLAAQQYPNHGLPGPVFDMTPSHLPALYSQTDLELVSEGSTQGSHNQGMETAQWPVLVLSRYLEEHLSNLGSRKGTEHLEGWQTFGLPFKIHCPVQRVHGRDLALG